MDDWFRGIADVPLRERMRTRRIFARETQHVALVESTIPGPTLQCVVKVSISPDNTTRNEERVYRALNRCCPIDNFPVAYTTYTGYIDMNTYTETGQTELVENMVPSSYALREIEERPGFTIMVPAHAIFIEYRRTNSIARFLRREVDMNEEEGEFEDKSIYEELAYSLLKQTIHALKSAYHACRFTHYDLHTSNVRVGYAKPGQEYVEYPDGTKVKTHGFLVFIIDFGESYVDMTDNEPIYGTWQFTHLGMTPHMPSKYVDMTRFFRSLDDEDILCAIGKRRTERVVHAMNRIAGAYQPNSVYLYTNNRRSFRSIVVDMYASYHKNDNDSIFSRIPGPTFDIIMSLVTHPLQYVPIHQPGPCYAIFLKHWTRIESQCSNMELSMVTLHFYVEVIRRHMDDLQSARDPATQRKVRTACARDFYTLVRCIAEYTPEDSFASFQELVPATLLFVQHIESLLYLATRNMVEYMDTSTARIFTHDRMIEVLQ